MDFSIITPSYNMLDWLKMCAASIRDQEGVTLEHLVHDACSSDGTGEWLGTQDKIDPVVEKDDGMYDAINHGYARAKGDYLAYINCDEQYLPGALKLVKEYFEENPEVDVAFGDVVIIDGEGQPLAFRKSVLPSSFLTSVHTLPILTCATFLRRRVFHQMGHSFNTKWRDVGDKVWTLEMVDAGVRMGLLKQYTTCFTVTGQNMNFSENAMREKAELIRELKPVIRTLKPVAKLVHKFNKWRSGAYRQEPFSYAIYDRTVSERKSIHYENPQFRFPEQ